MGIKKKQQSRRLTTRKREGLLKKMRSDERKKRKEKRRTEKKSEKVPIHILRTDEENERHLEIKRQERARKEKHELETRDSSERPLYLDRVARLISRNEVVAEVIDARDPESSRNYEVEEMARKSGKRMVMILNYTQYVPREVVDIWKRHLCSEGHWCVELEGEEMGGIEEGTKIGVFGNAKSGKHFVSKRLSHMYGVSVDSLAVTVPPSNTSLSSVLRGSHEISEIPFRHYITLVLLEVDKDEISLHYEIQEFEDTDEVLDHICDKYQIKGRDRNAERMAAAERFLSEFFSHRILFWRGVEECLSFKFPR